MTTPPSTAPRLSFAAISRKYLPSARKRCEHLTDHAAACADGDFRLDLPHAVSVDVASATISLTLAGVRFLPCLVVGAPHELQP
jgi:hypothetical protein